MTIIGFDLIINGHGVPCPYNICSVFNKNNLFSVRHIVYCIVKNEIKCKRSCKILIKFYLCGCFIKFLAYEKIITNIDIVLVLL